MHTLNRVLVKIYGKDSFLCLTDEDSREEVIDAARSWAESETEDYYPRVFDWRETETAGSWADEYPENVLLSKENIDRFVAELEYALEHQINEAKYHLNIICKTSSDIKNLFEFAFSANSYQRISPLWNLHQLSELMYGVYNCDSGFYDTHEYGAKITKATIDKVKESPNDWALVMFDYHY